MAEVVLKDVCKIYDGGVLAVNKMNLHIADQEFMALGTASPRRCAWWRDWRRYPTARSHREKDRQQHAAQKTATSPWSSRLRPLSAHDGV